MKHRIRHSADVAHHSPGRMRIRVHSAKGNPEALRAIRESLANIKGVREVSVSESIGSVVIHYDPNHHDDFHHHLAHESPAREVVSVAPPPCLEQLSTLDELIESEAVFLAQHSRSAKTLFDWTSRLDREIMRLTNHAVDLKVLAPATLAVAAFLELGVTAATPVWLTLGLFSFNHFVTMHTHEASKGVPRRPASEDEKKTLR